ncbi:hypothetical protein T492DRAFT_914722 [Pavlovales sp. CCMP2436]|nr:hypothetical protein T492DRAFT_914722 [Pavlovales sp. CCMP2436]
MDARGIILRIGANTYPLLFLYDAADQLYQNAGLTDLDKLDAINTKFDVLIFLACASFVLALGQATSKSRD